MPVRLHSSRISHEPEHTPRALPAHLPREPIRIGLVNSMPKAAFKATENQFLSLLNAASEDLSIELSLYVLRSTRATAHGHERATSRYDFVDELWGQHLDGLIVTGTEPISTSLKHEPYWDSLTQLLDWARTNTLSSVWSCLAAHAAILHMDGIERRRNHDKHFGVFQCQRVSEDRLLEGIASHFHIPHSRWNGVTEQDLTAHGYRVLTRTSDAEVDTFIKQEDSLFVFFQGHPEYATDTLLREYRRDIGRYLRKQADTYPLVPRGYFAPSSELAFSSLRETAGSQSVDQLLAGVSTAMDTLQIENTWRSSAVRLYRNWLEHLCESKFAADPHTKQDAARATYP
ncbi:MAG: homoserine O-succinyltransferase [Acidobacteriaceae bacterium]